MEFQFQLILSLLNRASIFPLLKLSTKCFGHFFCIFTAEIFSHTERIRWICMYTYDLCLLNCHIYWGLAADTNIQGSSSSSLAKQTFNWLIFRTELENKLENKIRDLKLLLYIDDGDYVVAAGQRLFRNIKTKTKKIHRNEKCSDEFLKSRLGSPVVAAKQEINIVCLLHWTHSLSEQHVFGCLCGPLRGAESKALGHGGGGFLVLLFLLLNESVKQLSNATTARIKKWKQKTTKTELCQRGELMNNSTNKFKFSFWRLPKFDMFSFSVSLNHNNKNYIYARHWLTDEKLVYVLLYYQSKHLMLFILINYFFGVYIMWAFKIKIPEIYRYYTLTC